MARKHARKEFVIIGLDSFGENLALSLQELGHKVLGIDRNREVVQRLSDNIAELAVLDAGDYETLASLGVEAFNTAVVAIGGDISQAILVTLALKELGIRHVVSEAQTDRDRRILLRVGADEVVAPHIESARSIARQLSGNRPREAYLRLGNQLAIKWRPPYPYQGTLSELMAGYPDDLQVLMLAGVEVIYNPGPETLVIHSDELLVAGFPESLSTLPQESIISE